MHRSKILKDAEFLINNDREKDYGHPKINHGRIADLWSVILERKIEPHEVALCMALVKISRLVQTPDHEDSYVDGAAYIAIAGELATEEES
jgi:hypothetical protein